MGTRGRGRGRGTSDAPRARPGFGPGTNRGRNAPDALLSKHHRDYSERPYLKPVMFVPSVLTRTLFQEEEDILQPVAESAGMCRVFWSLWFVLNVECWVVRPE
jgi:hypothetical protein